MIMSQTTFIVYINEKKPSKVWVIYILDVNSTNNKLINEKVDRTYTNMNHFFIFLSLSNLLEASIKVYLTSKYSS